MTYLEKLEKLNVFAIDPSLSNTGVYGRFSFSEVEYAISIKRKKEDVKEKQLNEIYRRISELNETHAGKSIALIEGYSFNSKNSNSVTTCAEVGGVIRLALYRNGTPYFEIPSMTWKKWSGFGKTLPKKGKQNITNYIKQGNSIKPFKYHNPDEVDAVMIYEAVSRYLALVDKGLREKKEADCLTQIMKHLDNC